MKDFKDWGVKQRRFTECNYNALWGNLKTVRLGEGKATALPATECEFYDVGINTVCNACCPWCYVSATDKGRNYEGICETWKKWMDTFWETKVGNLTRTNKPFQIAIGSTGEPTLHPEFCNFLQTVFETNVVPNYTTNGIILSDFYNKEDKEKRKLAEALIAYTKHFVGGVAVSFGNKHIRDKARLAINALIGYGHVNINIHHIISTKESVDEFVEEWLKYGDEILYHVLLPLMPAGRSTKGVDEGVFEYLEEVIDKNNIKNVAFGAHFIKNLRNSKIKTWLYDEESFSKNIILEKDCIKITPSSFDLNPIKIINL